MGNKLAQWQHNDKVPTLQVHASIAQKARELRDKEVAGEKDKDSVRACFVLYQL